MQTTHLIKKSVTVSCKEGDQGEPIQIVGNVNHPFTRGIMRFDDYNYNLINEYVLIEDPQDPLA